jgi:hypothetical protein
LRWAPRVRAEEDEQRGADGGATSRRHPERHKGQVSRIVARR